ncbi:MAG: hypothetical protein U0174_16705 [Polyangiaceae bacterium]
MSDRSKSEQDKATWQRRIDDALSRMKDDARRAVEQSAANAPAEPMI